MDGQVEKVTTTTVNPTAPQAAPTQVTQTTTSVHPPEHTESPKQVFEEKKAIFRLYQLIWYFLAIIETLLLFRFVLLALGANPLNGFVSFVYAITAPLTLPFVGMLPQLEQGSLVVDWASIVGMVVYALIAYALVHLVQMLRPVSRTEVERKVDHV
jgi:uncharacterized protein YggT (Ycf19 family)